MPKIALDAIDRRILDQLQRNARLSNVELAERVGLSPSPCLRRVRRLEEVGAIRRYVALLDPNLVGLGIVAFIGVRLERTVEQALDIFERAVRDRPEVLECFPITGDIDFLLKVMTRDLPAYEQLMREHILRIPGVSSTRTSFVLSAVKNETALPLESVEAQ
ncbi:MAG: Lrp/AsnC family transcriptional regulator [Alphaproteobacteria bacterium]